MKMLDVQGGWEVQWAVCVCVYVCLCVGTCVCMCMHVCGMSVHTCMCMHTGAYTCTCMCVHVACPHMCICACMCMHVYVCVHASVCVCLCVMRFLSLMVAHNTWLQGFSVDISWKAVVMFFFLSSSLPSTCHDTWKELWFVTWHCHLLTVGPWAS